MKVGTKAKSHYLGEGIITSLQNHFLVATAALNDTPFERSIVYICTHNDDGAMGMIVNHPLHNVTFKDIADSMGVQPLIEKKPLIYNGGPVEKNRGFVIHSPDYNIKSSLMIGPGIRLSATADVVGDIAKGSGPEMLAFCLGYAGWEPGQLEEELREDDWLVLPANPELLFRTKPEDKYDTCTQLMGLDALNYITVAGIA